MGPHELQHPVSRVHGGVDVIPYITGYKDVAYIVLMSNLANSGYGVQTCLPKRTVVRIRGRNACEDFANLPVGSMNESKTHGRMLGD